MAGNCSCAVFCIISGLFCTRTIDFTSFPADTILQLLNNKSLLLAKCKPFAFPYSVILIYKLKHGIMKTWIGILISLFSMISFQAIAQEFIGSNVRFSKEIESDGNRTATEIGLIRLNEQNNEFSFDISLFPILTSPRGNDSITNLNKQVNLNFRAEFPVSDLSFLTNDGTEINLTIPGELTINSRTHPVNLFMGIHSSLQLKDEARGIESYPALISFVLEINPADYGLDFETINFVRTISVEVRNGAINKTDSTPIAR
jgi:hypothetical protein